MNTSAFHPLRVRLTRSAAAVVLCAGVLSLDSGAAQAMHHEKDAAANHKMKGKHHAAVMQTVARMDIEYLRRQYARATDLIGTNDEAKVAEGRAIYHRIFTPDAKINTVDKGVVGFTATGPDAWVEVVVGALKVFDATQHLIGTQLVDIKSLPDAEGNGGEASMTSYLQAWHDDPDRVLDIFIGTYHDKVRFTPGVGWQIYEMSLEKVSGEVTDKTPAGD